MTRLLLLLLYVSPVDAACARKAKGPTVSVVHPTVGLPYTLVCVVWGSQSQWPEGGGGSRGSVACSSRECHVSKDLEGCRGSCVWPPHAVLHAAELLTQVGCSAPLRGGGCSLTQVPTMPSTVDRSMVAPSAGLPCLVWRRQWQKWSQSHLLRQPVVCRPWPWLDDIACTLAQASKGGGRAGSRLTLFGGPFDRCPATNEYTPMTRCTSDGWLHTCWWHHGHRRHDHPW